MDVDDDKFFGTHGLPKNVTYLTSWLLLAVESFVLVVAVESFVDSSVVVEIDEALQPVVEGDILSVEVVVVLQMTGGDTQPVVVVGTASAAVGNQLGMA